MYLTSSSIITACVLVSFIALILIALFRKGLIIRKLGPQCMIILLLLVVARMLLPFEYFYTYSIRVSKVFPAVRQLINEIIFVEPFPYTIWNLICTIWIVGILISVIRKIVAYRKIKKFELLTEEKATDVVVAQKDLERCPELGRLKIVKCEGLTSPYLFGIRSPKLFIPDVEYGNEQLRYILLHEGMHIGNRDIIWKIIIDLLCTVCWWNPVFVLLKRELFRIIEMRNDIAITHMLREEEQVKYMECLRDTALQLSGRDVAFGVSFSSSDSKSLKRRLNLIVRKDFTRKGQIAAVLLVCLCLFFTTTIIFEPSHMPTPEELDGAIPLTEENTCLIINGNQYDVYVDGEYLFQTDDLAPFPGIEIYENLEEAEEHDFAG